MTINKVVGPPEVSKVAAIENEHSWLASQQVKAAASPRRPIEFFETHVIDLAVWKLDQDGLSNVADVMHSTCTPCVVRSLPRDLVKPITPALGAE